MDVILLVVVAVGAALLAWFLSASQARGASEVERRELDGKVRAAEAVVSELRGQVEGLRTERSAEAEKLRQSEGARSAAETRLQEMQRTFQEQKQALDDAKQKLTDTFKSLAADTLKGANESFLTLAAERLTAIQKDSAGDLENRQKAIEHLVTPVKESLEKVDRQIREIEAKRAETYGDIKSQVESLRTTQKELKDETSNLVKALRAPVVRGRWGEIQLKRVVELAGMLDHCDFFEQESVQTEDGRLRPDLIVRLPAGRVVVVDAKAPLQAYLDALEAPDDEQRTARLRDHARQIRTHITKLAAKSYWDQFDDTPDFVVLFLPGETFFSAALEQDPSLIEEGVNQRVILATPTTLISLLRAVAYGWRQEQVARNAQAISAAGQELYERVATLVEHLVRLGGAIGNAVRSYNEAIGSLEARVLPSARKLKELGAGGKKDVAEDMPAVTTPVRNVSLSSEE